jgi:hypothetical protein
VKTKLLTVFKTAVSSSLLINCAMAISLLEDEEIDPSESNSLNVIVKLLSNEDTSIVNVALGAIWNLGHSSANVEVMRESGLVDKLVEFLKGSDSDLIMKSLGCLVTYGKDKKFAEEFNDKKGIKRLVPFVKDESKKKLHLYAVISIAVLAYHETVKKSIRENHLIKLLIDLLSSSSDKEILQKSLSALLNMSTDVESRKLIVEFEGICNF